MASTTGHLRRRLCETAEIGVGDGSDRQWPGSDVLLAAVPRPDAVHYVLALRGVALAGEALTGFLTAVAPFGCPVPGSLIRAYSLPDAPFPSILLKEHETGVDGVGDAYRRFLFHARHRWIAALQETGPGLCPVLAWQGGPSPRFLGPDDEAETLAEAGASVSGLSDGYLGRGLLLLAHPGIAGSWRTMMSLGGVTKIRKITGREFPVWVDLPAHQPDLLGSPLLARVEQLLGQA